MPVTFGNSTGDGQKTPLIQTQVEVPDSGTSIKVIGTVEETGRDPVNIAGSPVTAPAAPGSGSLYYTIQVNVVTGALSIKESTTAMPEEDSGNVAIFGQVLTSTTVNYSTAPSETPSY